ncbi:hypothetical protein [Phenylobacterium sp.]|uniref:hypothetical protein n=1 Tax=Phenylobacterium sp. TaxID=1871053 RepID=UPI002731F525|nr:hypothetical protein [Phenylobacterium sp.]MDP1873032.1 hypothetical protein [Phenylobacterium sp.]
MIPHLAPSLLFAGLILASAAPAQAQTVIQDRYGPPPAAATRGPIGVGTDSYGGPMLSWSGKQSLSPARAPNAPARPEPMALARQFAPQSSPAAMPAAFVPPPAVNRPAPAVQPGYEPVLRSSLPPTAGPAPGLLGGPPPGPLPTSIYDQAARPAPAQAQAQSFAQASAAARPGGSQLYSLHREYGMTPDAIPTPPSGPNYILVGPPDTPEVSDDGDEPAQGLDRQF